MMESEKEIQDAARIALSRNQKGFYFRVNIGSAWVSSQKPIKLGGGDIILKNARPFDTGIPSGFPDIFGITEITITPEMVGQKIGIFTGLEAKSPKGHASKSQKNMLEKIIKSGGIAGVFRTPEEAVEIVNLAK